MRVSTLVHMFMRYVINQGYFKIGLEIFRISPNNFLQISKLKSWVM